MKKVNDSLPIDCKILKIKQKVFNNKTFVLMASPGSGKTTRVPVALLEQFANKILVLEPRRLAAKFAASRIAEERRTELGQEVGYAFRFERCHTEESRLIFYTEGTFLRYLLGNPELRGIDVVILDEFHERHRETDIAWVLLQKIQKEVRPDLRLVIMSATLDKKIFSSETCFYEVETPIYPLEVHYLPHTSQDLNVPLEKKVYDALWESLDQEGDVLIFLPGMKDILRIKEKILPLCEVNMIDLYVLHGDLSTTEQSEVMKITDNRKIILSTNIAESSLTIPGVRIVIDSGLFRESSFSPWTGLSNLETKKISKASAIQRAGRAARTGPGHAYRLYSKYDFHERADFEKPEILRTDLCEMLLLLGNFDVHEVETLNWPDFPPRKALDTARQLLNNLGAFKHQQLTSYGKEMSRFPLHPRLACLMLEALKCGEAKAKEMVHFISSLEEDDFLAKRLSQQLWGMVKGKVRHVANLSTPIEALILRGFIDKIGILRAGKRLQILLCNGENLNVSRTLETQMSLEHSLVVVLNVSSFGEVTRFVFIEEDWLYDLEPFPLEERQVVFWDYNKKALFLNEELRLGQILLSQNRKLIQAPILNEDLKNKARQIMLEVISDLLKKTQKTEKYKRLIHLEKISKNKLDKFPMQAWLESKIDQLFSLGEDEEKSLVYDYFFSLEYYLDPAHEFSLVDFFPEQILLSDRRTVIIHYDEEPWVEGYIQDFFGLKETPMIANGRIPLVLRLLGPHKRPLQITRDLASFWSKTYKELFNELTREYPRHHWPKNPLVAPPILLKRQLPKISKV